MTRPHLAALTRGTIIKDSDGDNHVFLAYIAEEDIVVSKWEGHRSVDAWPGDAFPEPKQVIYVNVYSSATATGRYAANFSRAEADTNARTTGRIACVRVEFTPGQLDD
jgi:hypothetical protein